MAIGAWMLAAEGCTTRACEGDYLDWNTDPRAANGNWIDDTTWESNPVDGEWFYFPHQRSWRFAFAGPVQENGDGKVEVVEPIVYVSPDRWPNAIGGNFTVGSGNIAEVAESNYIILDGARVPSNTILVHNDTCADYYVRVVLHVRPAPKPADAPDAGPDGATDAANDASTSTDAPIDAVQDGPMDATIE
jgi:hypothetical protein